MRIGLESPTGVVEEVKIGVSWTTLFFGGFAALFRGDILWFILQSVAAVMTMGLSHLVFFILYNRIYLKKLLNKGYKPINSEGRKILQQKGYIK